MTANEFIVKLKADGSENDVTNLDNVYRDYKNISTDLPLKDRGTFAVNVLCTLCRNLEKVPTWTSKVDCKALLTLSIDCVRETRLLERAERVKTLACIYHIHKYVVRKNTSIPPELVLKISYMPFENETEHLLKEYCKTYWNILGDRFIYIEYLKGRASITKLFSKLSEDIIKVIHMYETKQFCMNILTFIVKRMHFLYSDSYTKELNTFFIKIFEVISSKSDLGQFKKLSEKELFELYIKLNECLYVVADHSSKLRFKESPLPILVKTGLSIVGHCPNMFHCLQTFYLNSFCSLLTVEPNSTYREIILSSLVLSCETAEKLGYIKTINATYPYINNLLRLYLEYAVTNSSKQWKNMFTEQSQESCLKFMLFLMKKLKNCEQLLKCENCNVKSGLHDALRLSFLAKNFVSISIQEGMAVTKTLPVYYSIVLEQYNIIKELCHIGCANYEKCSRKLQADIHNTAILLNQNQNFDYSINLFNIYLKYETDHFKDENDLKKLCRALYNKSICELDCKKYESALKDAYLSLVFSQPDGLATDKYMSLVMDIKAKALKAKSTEDSMEENLDELQMMTVLEACVSTAEDNEYGNLKPFFCMYKFSTLLRHEFGMYVKLWPSIVPVAGVWRSLYDLSKGRQIPWLKAKDDGILQTLYEVVLETPTAVRTIHSEYYANIVTALLEQFQKKPASSPALRVVYATLLALKTEYDLHEASTKYGWKVTEPTLDPDQIQAIRTFEQEHGATKCAIQSVLMMTSLVEELNNVPSQLLRHAFQVVQVLVPLLLHLHRPGPGLQMAHTCCAIAEHLGDRESYIRNAGVLLHHGIKKTKEMDSIIAKAGKHWPEVVKNRETMETALVFLCDTAVYHIKIGALAVAAKTIRNIQARILQAYEKFPDINLEMAVGRLMEASALLCKNNGLSALSAVNGAQKHYLAVPNGGSKWSVRRLRSLTLKQLISASGLRGCGLARALRAWRRARAAGAAGLVASAAAAQARLYKDFTDCHATDDAQIKIDNRLKYILGLQNEIQPYHASKSKPESIFTPKPELETMLESVTFKKTQSSPSLPCLSVPGYRTPEFLKHRRLCDCYACENPYCSILAAEISGLEASTYYRAKEFDIARNYFEGALLSLTLVEGKITDATEKMRETYQEFLVDIVEDMYRVDLKRVEVQILIEKAFFELTRSNFDSADECAVRIHENLEHIDPYTRTEVLNLLTTSARLRHVRKPVETGLEAEMESLRLSPSQEPPKTPESKPAKPPVASKVVLKDDEIPNAKRKVIKLNLDDVAEETPIQKRTTRRTFKIPVPITSKAVLETVTPIHTRIKSKPNIIVTASSFDFVTPKPKEEKPEFFTPLDTPSEQFFTPMTSVKTYSKSLRHGIVKNLEKEFSTPKTEKENTPLKEDLGMPKSRFRRVETGSVKSLKDRRALKRATSPGKLVKEEKTTTAPRRRLRQPVRFSIDEETK